MYTGYYFPWFQVPFEPNEKLRQNMVEFSLRYFIAFAEKLQQEGITVKNLENVKSKLGSAYKDYIKMDLLIGMTVYFIPQKPYFLTSTADLHFLLVVILRRH